jgi:hypothetical protein
MKRLVLVLALVVAGCNAPAATPVPTAAPTAVPTHVITGQLTLIGFSTVTLATQCFGKGGYDDLKEGATVTLRDQSSTILASTALGAGVASAGACTFPFTLTGVPDTASFYVIEVSHRGQVTKSHAEMVDAGWIFDLTIGS